MRPHVSNNFTNVKFVHALEAHYATSIPPAWRALTSSGFIITTSYTSSIKSITIMQ